MTERPPVETIWSETLAAFEWLARAVDVAEPITFVPNAGNVGDALINISCYRYLTAHFRSVTVSSLHVPPPTECVFVAGGGNLVEALYDTIANFVQGPARGRRLFFFPSTVGGYDRLLDQIAGRSRIVCRDATSYAHVRRHLAEDAVHLGHDAAFAVADRLQAAFGPAIAFRPPAVARFLRQDVESVGRDVGDGDIMTKAGGEWTDLGFAEQAVVAVAQEILFYGRVHTDRLHCAILSAMLDREVVLLPNSYFKNQAVFEHSLAHLPNVRFERDSADAARA